MAETNPDDIIEQIGETAGVVWGALARLGPLTFAKLVKEVDQPRDTVMQAVGWLARENKITITEQRRVRVVSLR